MKAVFIHAKQGIETHITEEEEERNENAFKNVINNFKLRSKALSLKGEICFNFFQNVQGKLLSPKICQSRHRLRRSIGFLNHNLD